MKLLAITQEFAGKPILRLQWNKEGYFFADPQPDVPSLIALDLPGLRSNTEREVRAWLVEYHRNAGRSGEHVELVQGVWRPMVLEDLLDATNPSEVAWHLSRHFTLAELAAFAATHGPVLYDDVQRALATPRDKQSTALRKAHRRANRIAPALTAGVQRIAGEADQLELRDDRLKVERLGSTFDAATWIDTAASLRHDAVKRELLDKIGQQLVATGAPIAAALDRMVERNLDRVHAPELWTAIGNHVSLAANIQGETIDLRKAREVTVPLAWNAWKAGRVGTIKFLRPALMVVVGTRIIYVRGQRKLLHSIRARGGTLARYGCTLAVGRKADDSAHAKLLEVDRIDTLAQVDPASALRLVESELPAAHPIAMAAGRALQEPRWRRILADLLIEKLVGIDADVARRLARAEARANRR